MSGSCLYLLANVVYFTLIMLHVILTSVLTAGCSIPNVDFCRDLGVTMTSTLSMSRHINDITTKAHQRANCILRSFVSGDVALLVRAFTVYVRPIVEYNSVIWSPQTKLEIKKNY